jgi:hypothetical protein
MAWEIILMAAVPCEAPPAMETTKSAVFAIVCRFGKPALELVKGKTTVPFLLGVIELMIGVSCCSVRV